MRERGGGDGFGVGAVQSAADELPPEPYRRHLTGWGRRALPGAGRFAAYADHLPDVTWLELTAHTVAQQPALNGLHKVAERAAQHPQSPQAFEIMTAIVPVRTDGTYSTGLVRRHARTLYTTSSPRQSPERTALRDALVNADQVDLMFFDEDNH